MALDRHHFKYWKLCLQAHLILLCLLLLHFEDNVFFFFFLQIEGLWQSCVEQVYVPVFPRAFAHFLSLGHILVILTIFQTFSLLLYLL